MKFVSEDISGAATDESNLAKGGITVHRTPCLYSPVGSSYLQLYVLVGGLTSKILLSLWGSGTPI